MDQDPKQLEMAEILEKSFFWCEEFSSLFRESWQQSEAITVLCLSLHIAHCPPRHREGLIASRHTGFAAHVSRWAVSPWDLQNLQCFKILLLSFLLSLSILFLFCFLILTMHSHRDHQVTRAGLGWQCPSVHAHTWQDNHVSSKTPRVDNNWSAIYERKNGNWRTTFPCFSRKNRVNS